MSPPASPQQSQSTPNTKESRDVVANGDDNRRSFFTKLLAVCVGGLAGAIPTLAGLAVFFDPLRKRKQTPGGGVDDEGFVRITSATLEGLLVGTPRRFTVIDDLSDAWNIFPQEPVGTIYLLRTGEKEVQALNAICPHAGCQVDFERDRALYQCPCHKSSFKTSGEIANENSPSPRGMDPLEVKIKHDTEIWVKFQNFLGGTTERIPV